MMTSNNISGYGSLDKYRLCTKKQKRKQPFFKLVVCVLFFAACVYFALVLSAAAQTTTNAQIDEGKCKHKNDLGEGTIQKNISYNSVSVLKTGDRLPLLQRRVPAANSRIQNHASRSLTHKGKKSGIKKAKVALMVLGLMSGARYALAAPIRQTKTQPPFPPKKPVRDVRKRSDDIALVKGSVQKRVKTGGGKVNACCVPMSPHAMTASY